MSDKKTTGAYIPFRELLTNSLAATHELFGEADADMMNYFSYELMRITKSINHYDELLRLHNLQEVK